MTTPKRILIAAIHFPVSGARYYTDAFKRLGHDVRTIGPYTANWIPWGDGMELDMRFAWRPDYYVEGIGFSMVGAEDCWQPDLVITGDSSVVFTHRFDAPHIAIAIDSHVQKYDQRPYDYHFIAHSQGPALPLDESNPKHVYLPCAYDPVHFTPSPIPMADREYDVCCVGVMYPRRVEIIEAMRAAGLKVFAATGLLYSDFTSAYHNSKIALCVSAASDMAQRVFECSALGNVILSDFCPDMPRLGFNEWTHYAPLESTSEAVDTAQRLIASYRECDRLAEASSEWVKGHEWDARAQVIMDTMFGGE